MADIRAESLGEAFADELTDARTVQRLVVVLFDGAMLGSMSFAFGVFDIATQYGGLPGVEVKVVAGEPGATLVGGGLACAVPYDLRAIRDGVSGGCVRPAQRRPTGRRRAVWISRSTSAG